MKIQMKRMGSVSAFMVVLACAISVHATVVNFTAAEGYSGDGASWPSRLTAQVPTVGANWVETVAGGTGRFRVNSTGSGTVKIDGDVGYNRAVYQEAFLSSASSYTVGINFSFDRAVTAPTAVKKVVAVEFTEVAAGGNRIAMHLEREANANGGKYQLVFYENTGTASKTAVFGWSSETLLGFADASDLMSDNLWLEMTLYRGADASSWTASGLLSNTVTGASIVMDTSVIGMFDTSSAYFSNNLYGVVNSCDLNTGAFVSNRQINSFEVTAAIPEPATIGMLGLGTLIVLIVRRKFHS